jgi:hypothetical protein
MPSRTRQNGLRKHGSTDRTPTCPSMTRVIFRSGRTSLNANVGSTLATASLKDSAVLTVSPLFAPLSRCPALAANGMSASIVALTLSGGMPQHQLVNVSLNEGLHYGGIVLAPPVSRLRCSLDEHFRYVSDKLERIHAEPITNNATYVMDYAAKTYKRGRVSDEDIIILPKSRSELPLRSPVAAKIAAANIGTCCNSRISSPEKQLDGASPVGFPFSIRGRRTLICI